MEEIAGPLAAVPDASAAAASRGRFEAKFMTLQAPPPLHDDGKCPVNEQKQRDSRPLSAHVLRL